MKAVFKREFKAFFTSVTGWIFIAAFLFLFDLYFFVYNLSYGYAYLSYPLSSITFIFLILVPVLTMRILSEDRKLKTDQMIFTAPIPIWKAVFGKFLSMTAVFSIVIGIICLCPPFLSLFGTVPMAESYTAILGTWLFGILSIAVGLFVSSLTENQVISAILTFAFLFLGYMMDSICTLISSNGNLLTKILGTLSISDYMNQFLTGTFDLAGIVYYLSGCGLFLFLTCQVLQKSRFHAAVKKVKAGVFSTGLIVLGLAVVVGLNFGVSKLPDKFTSLDVTYNDLYSLTKGTKEYVSGIEDDITIYVLVSSSEKDETLDKTLKMYQSQSKHIKVKYIDPASSPQFYSTYTDTEPASNSLIVVKGEKSKVIDYSKIYETSFDSSTYSSQTTGYDGEGQITSALSYVVSENLPQVYVIQGHGEADLETEYLDAVEKLNMKIKEVNLLKIDEIPQETAGIIINGPTSDFSEDDAKKVSDYLAKGGKALITTNYAADSSMKNFDAILADFDIRVEKGIVMEGSGQNYYQYPFYLLPDIQTADATASLDNYIFVPDGQALTNLGKKDDQLEWTQLLTTSDSAYIKEDIQNMTTYEKEEADKTGQYTVAASVVNNETKAEVTVMSSIYTFTSDIDTMVSGNNMKMFTNITGKFQTEDTEAVSVPVKSYTLGALTVNQLTAAACAVILIIVLPVVLLTVGIVIWIKRRKR